MERQYRIYSERNKVKPSKEMLLRKIVGEFFKWYYNIRLK